MEFHPDGTLQYSIELPDKTQIIKLTYSVLDDVIISKQPSSQKEERTRFSLVADGTLKLDHDGTRLWFQRVE